MSTARTRIARTRIAYGGAAILLGALAMILCEVSTCPRGILVVVGVGIGAALAGWASNCAGIE